MFICYDDFMNINLYFSSQEVNKVRRNLISQIFSITRSCGAAY